MADLPIMPIYTDALLSDCGYLPNEAFGGYVRLLVTWWRNGAKPISEAKLRAYSGLTGEQLDLIKDHLTETAAGWTQKRLATEWDRQQSKRLKAKASARARWSEPGEHASDMRTHDPGTCYLNANASAEHMRSGCEPDANRMLSINHEPYSPSPNGDGSRRARTKAKAEKPLTRLPEDFRPPTDWIDDACEKGSITASEAWSEAEAFVAYWCEVPGAKGKKREWKRTWINYITGDIAQKRVAARRRNQSDDRSPSRSAGGGSVDELRRGIAQAALDLRHEAHSGGGGGCGDG